MEYQIKQQLRVYEKLIRDTWKEAQKELAKELSDDIFSIIINNEGLTSTQIDEKIAKLITMKVKKLKETV